MTQRVNILQRILNLRELADSSSSEAEAMNAMKIADKMMQAYRIEEAELALAEGSGEITVNITDETKFDVGLQVGRNRHKVQSCIWTLEKYCEIEIVLKNNWSKGQGIHAIGDKPDVELFWYLLDLIRNALDKEYARWKRGQQGIGRGAKASFQLAMASRINSRLHELLAERRKEQDAAIAAEAKLLNKSEDEIRVAVNSGNLNELRSSMAVNNGELSELSSSMALVVMGAAQQKREAVSAAYKAAYKGARLGTASGFSYGGNTGAAQAGYSAGDRVNFGRPVGGSSKRLT